MASRHRTFYGRGERGGHGHFSAIPVLDNCPTILYILEPIDEPRILVGMIFVKGISKVSFATSTTRETYQLNGVFPAGRRKGGGGTKRRGRRRMSRELRCASKPLSLPSRLCHESQNFPRLLFCNV